MIALFFCELTVAGDPEEDFSFRGPLAVEMLLGVGTRQPSRLQATLWDGALG